MKKLTFTLITIIVLVLTACGGGNTPDTQQFGTGQNGDAVNTEMSLASKLATGSFKLEGTANAITPEQASELILLWQVYAQLSTSDTVAQEEITALAEQIQETMTEDQITAIHAMNLTPQDIFTTMQEQGIQFVGNGQGGAPEAESNGEFPALPGGGDTFFIGPGPGGGASPGGGPGGGFGDQNLSPDQIATAQAARAENGGGFRFNSAPAPLIEALVKLLQEKTGG
jgi:hypothetical protein